MAENYGSGSAANTGCCAKCDTCIQNARPETLLRINRVMNSICAGLLFTAGFWALFFDSVDTLSVIISLYVIGFSSLLLLYELRLSCMQSFILNNLGFMFGWRGRAAFYLFVGTMSMGLSTFGVISGILTIMNLVWNVFLSTKHRAYRTFVDAEGNQMEKGALTKEAQKRGIVEEGTEMLDSKRASNEGLMGDLGDSIKDDGGGGIGELPPGWEKLVDAASGDPYYYNESTNETTWDMPTS